MVFNITNLDLKCFIEWIKLHKKNYNHEHLAFYFYISQNMTEKSTVVLSYKKILSEFLTLKTERQINLRVAELSEINLFSYIIDGPKTITLKIDLSLFSLLFSEFSKSQNDSTKSYLIKVFFLLKNSNFKNDFSNSLSDNINDLLLNEVFRSYNFLEQRTCLAPMKDFDKFLNTLTENKKVFSPIIDQYFKNNPRDNFKTLLSQEDNNIYQKYLNIWNRYAENNNKMTKHTVKDFTKTPVSKDNLFTINILKKLEKSNIEDLPDFFSVFKNKPLTASIFEFAVSTYGNNLFFKKTTTKGRLHPFIYNVVKNYSWLCQYTTFKNIDYEPRNDLKNIYREYTLLLNKNTVVNSNDNLEIISIVNSLKDEFDFLNKSIFWFYKLIDKSFHLHFWKNFSNAHFEFIKSNYANPNINILKIKINNGKKSKSFYRFINWIRDKNGWNLDPTAEEMKLMLQKRALFLKKSGLLSKKHKYLTEIEYKMYKNQEIILLYDD